MLYGYAAFGRLRLFEAGIPGNECKNASCPVEAGSKFHRGFGIFLPKHCLEASSLPRVYVLNHEDYLVMELSLIPTFCTNFLTTSNGYGCGLKESMSS